MVVICSIIVGHSSIIFLSDFFCSKLQAGTTAILAGRTAVSILFSIIILILLTIFLAPDFSLFASPAVKGQRNQSGNGKIKQKHHYVTGSACGVCSQLPYFEQAGSRRNKTGNIPDHYAGNENRNSDNGQGWPHCNAQDCQQEDNDEQSEYDFIAWGKKCFEHFTDS